MPPPRVVRHDGDDPYLVVAADKGTATFSDIANEISARARLLARRRLRLRRLGRLRPQEAWRSPRAAPGSASSATSARWTSTSSASRSAWWASATCRATCSATACCCRSTSQLVAAFDHRDIFIDPNPQRRQPRRAQAACSTLPRSSWQDYDKAKISKGGGVFSALGQVDPAQRRDEGAAGLDAASLTPAELMRAVLKCKTDLLWFGGIGTYMRASAERDDEVGDRANDPLRVTAAEVQRQGDRRGRQPRRDAARPHRVRRPRRAHQHRLHRQLGRRQHLRPGGQHQDRARAGDALGQARAGARATSCSPT